MLAWGELAGRLQRSTIRHLGEDGTIDGLPARFVAINPPETLDLGESEYHGQHRRFAVIDATAPAYEVGAIVGLRGRMFEVTAIVSDGEGMHELTVRERNPDTIDQLTIRRLQLTAVTAGTGQPDPAAPVADVQAWLAANGVSDDVQPSGLLPYELTRWLDRHLIRGA